jgi:hypothetical protein
MMGRPWEQREIDRIVELCPDGHPSIAVIAQIAAEFDRTEGAIRTKITMLDLTPRRTYEADAYDARLLDDGRFAIAMMAAVDAGLEHPPMLGVDTRPCTVSPIFIKRADRAALSTKSVLADA